MKDCQTEEHIGERCGLAYYRFAFDLFDHVTIHFIQDMSRDEHSLLRAPLQTNTGCFKELMTDAVDTRSHF